MMVTRHLLSHPAFLDALDRARQGEDDDSILEGLIGLGEYEEVQCPAPRPKKKKRKKEAT